MKKFICTLMVTLLLWGLALSVSATADPAETHDWAGFGDVADIAGVEEELYNGISEDLTVLTLDGETYHRMDASAFQPEYYWSEDFPLPLSEAQQAQINNAYWEHMGNKAIVSVTIIYWDGVTWSAYYVKDSLRDTLTDMLEGETSTVTVEQWLKSRNVTASLKDFKGTPIKIKGTLLNYATEFEVLCTNEYLELSCQRGIVLEEDGKFYYVDFQENNIHADHFNRFSYGYLDGYEITDPTLLQELEESTELYYSDTVGALYDDDFTEAMSVGVLVLIFGIFPGALLILAVIRLIQTKSHQRKAWIATAALAASELAVFGVLVVVFIEAVGK